MTETRRPVVVSEPDTPATARFSPVDVLRSVLAAALLVVLLALGLVFEDPVQGFLAELLRGIDALGADLLTVIVIGTRALVVAAVVGALGAAVVAQRWRLLVTCVLASMIGATIAGFAGGAIEVTEAPLVTPTVSLGVIDDHKFPTMAGLGAATALLTAASPWLSRRWRRVGWALVIALAVCRFLTAPVSLDVSIALAAGWLAGSLVLVTAGAPSRRPTGQAVADALVEAGVPLATLSRADVDARGSTPYFGRTSDDGRVFAKVVAQDERSADLLFRLYRAITPRDLGDERPFSSLRRMVEHEAMVSLMARGVGVTTPRVLAFAAAEPGGFVLSYEGIDGASLDGVDPERLDEDVLDAIWTQVVTLRHHRIAHRDLRLANVFLGTDGEVAMIDFGFSELAASDLLLRTDIAELLAALSLTVGPDRAIAAAIRLLGEATVADAAERLDPTALSGATRTAYKSRPGELDALRATCKALA